MCRRRIIDVVVKSVKIRVSRMCTDSKAFPPSSSVPEIPDTGMFSCDFLVLLNSACMEGGQAGVNGTNIQGLQVKSYDNAKLNDNSPGNTGPGWHSLPFYLLAHQKSSHL